MKIEIERLNDLGRGICYVNNKITFIPNYLVVIYYVNFLRNCP